MGPVGTPSGRPLGVVLLVDRVPKPYTLYTFPRARNRVHPQITWGRIIRVFGGTRNGPLLASSGGHLGGVYIP